MTEYFLQINSKCVKSLYIKDIIWKLELFHNIMFKFYSLRTQENWQINRAVLPIGFHGTWEGIPILSQERVIK